MFSNALNADLGMLYRDHSGWLFGWLRRRLGGNTADVADLVLDTLTRIDQALDRLPDRVSRAFLVSRFEGLTYHQVAARLGVSHGVVRKYMLKAAQACLLALDEAPR